jgi:outer membrane protein assembly factor BamB
VARSAFDPFSVMPGPVKAFVRECVVEKAGRETLDRLERERTASGAEQELVRWCEDNARASLGDRAQPLAVAAPPDHAVDRSVGQVIVSTWNPVTITPFEDQADLYFTIRNVGATIATVEIDGTAAQRVALATWDTHLLAFHELVGGASPFFVLAPTRLEPGQSASLRVRLPFGAGQIREFVELILPFTFRVQETGDQDTIPIAIRTQAGLAFTAFAKTSQIVGRVAATDGRPIGGALVQVWIGMTSDPVSIRTWTDGTYKIAVPSGADLRTVLGPRPRVWTETAMTYSLSASQRGYSYGYRAGIVPEPGRAAQIDLTLRPLPPLSYRVAGEFKTSGPIGFWWVRLAGAGNLIVATEGRHDPSLRVPAHIYGLDLAGQERWSIPTGDQCWGLDVSDDGQLIAAGCADSFVYVITASGQLLRKIGGIFGEGPFQPRFSPDGRLLLADTRTGPSVIDPRSGAVLWSISSRLTSHQVRNVRWSPDRQRVVIGDAEGRLTMVDVTGRLLWQVYLGHLTFSLSIDERYNVYVGSKSGVYYAFDAQGNRRWEWGRSSYHGPRQMPTDGRFVVLSPGSKKIVEMLDSSGTLLWDHHFGHPREAVGGGAGHNAIDITPDGTLIAVGFEDNEVVLMDARGDLLWTDRRSVRPELAPMVSTDAPGIQGVAISADGRYIVVGFQDSVIRVFERQ